MVGWGGDEAHTRGAVTCDCNVTLHLLTRQLTTLTRLGTLGTEDQIPVDRMPSVHATGDNLYFKAVEATSFCTDVANCAHHLLDDLFMVLSDQ